MAGGEGEGGGGPEPSLGKVSFDMLRAMSMKELEWLIEHAKRGSVKLGAIREVLSRTDVVPRPPLVQAVVQGDVSITWAPSSSPTLLAPSRPNTMPPLLTNGHGPASPSATDDLANL